MYSSAVGLQLQGHVRAGSEIVIGLAKSSRKKMCDGMFHSIISNGFTFISWVSVCPESGGVLIPASR